MKTTAWDMRKVEKIAHPLIDEWAGKHFALEAEMRATTAKLTDSELQALRLATTSLTMTNCWFAEYDVKETLEQILALEEQTRAFKRIEAASSSQSAALGDRKP